MEVAEANLDLQVGIPVKRLNDLTQDQDLSQGQGLTLESDITRKSTPDLRPQQLLHHHVLLKTSKFNSSILSFLFCEM